MWFQLKTCLQIACFLVAGIVFSQVDAKTKKHAAIEPVNCAKDAGWNDPAVARHVYGNTWYVGTCGISSILITSGKGHILIDGAADQGAALIAANIRALGFKLKDVRYILSTHEHADHAGGIAQLQRDTGAVVIASSAAASTLERGSSDRSDPQFKTTKAFAPVLSVRRISDNETLVLGPIKIKAHATPGHTPGSTSWTWVSCVAKDCKKMAYVDSLTAISDDDYLYSDEAKNPGVPATFRNTIQTVAQLPCDILITPHPGASNFFARLSGEPDTPLVDQNACRRYSENADKNFTKRIEEEKGRKP